MLTLLSCGQGQNGSFIDALIAQFKTRVALDGGTFEAESCLETTLEALDLQYPPLVVEAPVITGSVAIGSLMSVSNGVFDGITPLTYTYQWYLDGSPISGAKSSTYTTDNTGDLTCVVTATNSFGSASGLSNLLNITEFYFVRPAGTTYGTGDGTSYDNAWGGFNSIDWNLLDGNTLNVCGTHNQDLLVQSDNVIIVGNNINENGIIDGQNLITSNINIDSYNNVIINNLESINATRDCLMIQGTSANIITNNCTFNGCGNQGIQHLDTVTATHNNPTCKNNADDGISLHDSAIVTINGGLFENNDQAINTIANSTTTINGNPTFISNTGYDVWATNAITESSCTITINNSTINGLVSASQGAKIITNNSTLTNIAISSVTLDSNFEANNSIVGVVLGAKSKSILNNCLVTNNTSSTQGKIEFYKCRVTNDFIASSNAYIKARHTMFADGDDINLDFTSGSTCDVMYCVFYNSPNNQFGVALRTGSTLINYANNTHVGISNVGRGYFAQASNTVYNNIYTNLAVGAIQSTNSQTLENCCFFNNTTNKIGTFTSNDEVTTNPNFVSETSLDFRLGTGSSCIGTGETLTDSEGIETADWGNGTTELPIITTKNQTASWNIGAYVN